MDLQSGAIIDVVVSSVEEFGVLVKFEDKQGVVSVTNIYWDNDGAQTRMFESFKAGQQLRVKVLGVAPEQFWCSIKHLRPEEGPWCDPSIYVVGAVHEGVVTHMFDDAAALVRLPNGAKIAVEGPRPEIKLNDQVSVMITRADVEKQKLEGRLL
jgi:ribosomal protein S1